MSDLRERVAEAIVAYENERGALDETSVDGYTDAALAEVAAWLGEQVEVVARALAECEGSGCFVKGTPSIEKIREPRRDEFRAKARAVLDALVALLRGEPQSGPQSDWTPETRESPSGDPERPSTVHREAENDAIRANGAREVQEDQ